MAADLQGFWIVRLFDPFMECCFANPQICRNFPQRQEIVFEKCSAAHVSLFLEWVLNLDLLGGEVDVI